MDEDKEALFRLIEDSDVSYVMNVGVDVESCREVIAEAAQHPWCYATVGYQPGEVGDFDPQLLAEFRRLALEPKVCAVGEIGLEYHYGKDNIENQQRWFREQIRMANELKMPIMLHTREADEDTMRILKEEGAFSAERKSWFPGRPGPDGTEVEDARVMFHCFSSSREIARQYVKLGATISICGPVTYKNNRRTTEVVQDTPIEFLLVETDAPYLTPEPLRGRPNKSTYVEYTARRVAALKGMPYEEAARITCENARRFFGIE
jgi:TatD DNase family protein